MKCKCGGEIMKVPVGFTHRWTCQDCQRDYGYRTNEPIMTEIPLEEAIRQIEKKQEESFNKASGANGTTRDFGKSIGYADALYIIKQVQENEKCENCHLISEWIRLDRDVFKRMLTEKNGKLVLSTESRRLLAEERKKQECCICGTYAECNEVSIGGGVHFRCCSRKCLNGLFEYLDRIRAEERSKQERIRLAAITDGNPVKVENAIKKAVEMERSKHEAMCNECMLRDDKMEEHYRKMKERDDKKHEAEKKAIMEKIDLWFKGLDMRTSHPLSEMEGMENSRMKVGVLDGGWINYFDLKTKVKELKQIVLGDGKADVNKPRASRDMGVKGISPINSKRKLGAEGRVSVSGQSYVRGERGTGNIARKSETNSPIAQRSSAEALEASDAGSNPAGTNEDISLCQKCYCLTKNIRKNGVAVCGKCNGVK